MKAEDCGMLKQGTSVIIDGYTARVEKDFNLYEAVAGFIVPVEPDREAFFNYLEENGLIVNIVPETSEYDAIAANGYYLMSQLPKLEDWQFVATMLGDKSEWPLTRIHYLACSLDNSIQVKLMSMDDINTTPRKMFNDIPLKAYGSKELIAWMGTVQACVHMDVFKNKLVCQKEQHNVLVMKVFDNETGCNTTASDNKTVEWDIVKEKRDAFRKQLVTEYCTIGKLLTTDEIEGLISNVDRCPPNCEFTVRELLDRNIDNIRTNYFGLMYLSTF